jgi:hypothetical protein
VAGRRAAGDDRVSAPPAVVCLWQADGPSIGSRGVCDDRETAMARAEGCLLEGATGAIVEEAAPGLGASSLAGCWRRTGAAWLASADGAGRVEWTAVTAQRTTW